MKRRSLVVVLLLLFAVGVAGVVWLAVPGEKAVAGTASDFAKASTSELVQYIQSGASLNLRLMALEVVRKKSGSTADLVAIAKGNDLAIAAYACGSIGRQNTSDAKTALKDLVTNTKLGTEVRKAAMSAMASTWQSEDDLAWLKREVASDSGLKTHANWLETYVYEK